MIAPPSADPTSDSSAGVVVFRARPARRRGSARLVLECRFQCRLFRVRCVEVVDGTRFVGAARARASSRGRDWIPKHPRGSGLKAPAFGLVQPRRERRVDVRALSTIARDEPGMAREEHDGANRDRSRPRRHTSGHWTACFVLGRGTCSRAKRESRRRPKREEYVTLRFRVVSHHGT